MRKNKTESKYRGLWQFVSLFLLCVSVLLLARLLLPLGISFFSHLISEQSGKIEIHVGRLTLALDKGLLELLDGKWKDLTQTSASLLPLPVRRFMGKLGECIFRAIENTVCE